MIVVISSEGAVTLTDPSEFRAFKVVAASDVDVDTALRRAGAGHAISGDHVGIAGGWLLEQAGDLADQAEWRSGYDAMVSYAESKGWLQGDQITAHVDHAS